MAQPGIALATRKPKTFYISVKILENLGLAFHSCAPGEKYCRDAKIIITTQSESRRLDPTRVLIIDDTPDETTTSLDIMMRYLSSTAPKEIIIGIDPGLHNGLAVVVDGKPTYGRVLASPIDTADITTKLMRHSRETYSDSRVIIRIGLGSKLYSALLLRCLLDKMPDVRLELVDERYTTTQGGYFKDQFSAELIAVRAGRQIQETDLDLEPKRGFLRGLQHLFSWLTDKRGELSVDTARSILIGETSLSQALAEFHQLEKNRSTV
jgi:hypothetical protein